MKEPIEADIEQAIVAVILEQLEEDDHEEVPVTAITLGSPGDEAVYPMVHVACQPLAGKGAKVKEWTGQVVVNIRTKHLTGKDRDASTLVSLFGSVSYALDFGDFTEEAKVLNSIHMRRGGGDYIFADSTNEVNITCAVTACGIKST
jgi:hypothetical protein